MNLFPEGLTCDLKDSSDLFLLQYNVVSSLLESRGAFFLLSIIILESLTQVNVPCGVFTCRERLSPLEPRSPRLH